MFFEMTPGITLEGPRVTGAPNAKKRSFWEPFGGGYRQKMTNSLQIDSARALEREADSNLIDGFVDSWIGSPNGGGAGGGWG